MQNQNVILIYHFSVILISLIVFFLRLTAPNAIFELIIRALGKLVPFFTMVYAAIQNSE
jgi:uncharacterized membrane protein